MNKKNGKYWKELLDLLNIRNGFKLKQYDSVPGILKEMNNNVLAFQVRNSYYLADCYYHLGNMEESIKQLNWVIKNGNNLCFVEMSKQLLEKISKKR